MQLQQNYSRRATNSRHRFNAIRGGEVALPIGAPIGKVMGGEGPPDLPSASSSPWSQTKAISSLKRTTSRSEGYSPEPVRNYRPASSWSSQRKGQSMSRTTRAISGEAPVITAGPTGSNKATVSFKGGGFSAVQRISARIANSTDWYQMRAAISMNREQLNMLHVTAALSRLAAVAAYPKQVGASIRTGQ